MKKTFLILALLASSSSFAFDNTEGLVACSDIKKDKQRLVCFDQLVVNMKQDPVAVIKPFVKAWSPMSMVLEKEVLTITLDQQKITKPIYKAVITTGVCGSVYLSKQKWGGIKEIIVQNKHEKQGFLFEGGYKECKALGKLSGKEGGLAFWGKTRVK